MRRLQTHSGWQNAFVDAAEKNICLQTVLLDEFNLLNLYNKATKFLISETEVTINLNVPGRFRRNWRHLLAVHFTREKNSSCCTKWYSVLLAACRRSLGGSRI
jgi:hypothetical protein